MTSFNGPRVFGISLVALVALLASAIPASAAIGPPAPAWAPIAISGPTSLPPGGTGEVAIYVQNVGGITSSGTITVRDELPAGLTTSGTPTSEGNVWSCTTGPGQSTVECTTVEPVGPGLAAKAIIIPLDIGPEGKLENVIEASSTDAAEVGTYKQQVTISPTPAKPGVAAFTSGAYNVDGTLTTLAASHPYTGTGAVFVNTVLAPDGETIVPAGDPKTIEVALPPGFLGNPTATPRCTEGLKDDECPVDTQVGVIQPVSTEFGNNDDPDAVHAVEAPVGYPAKFTFSIGGGLLQANVVASLRSDTDYGVTLTSPNTPQISPVYGSFVSIWGAPADISHENQRCVIIGSHSGCGPGGDDKAFVTMASDCALQAAQPPFAELKFDTWLTIGEYNYEKFPFPTVTGCDELELAASFAFTPETHTAATPSAFSSELTLPQGGLEDPSPDARATPPPKRAAISFPPGVTLNAAASEGLGTCSLEQIGYEGNAFAPPNRIHFDKEPAKCPDASKVGTLEVKSALLDNALHGSLYLAAQNANPFGSLLAVYLVIEDPNVGIIIKLPGKVEPDPVTGQLTTVFDDLPQAAVGRVKLTLEGGERAPLATPDTCGTATTVGRFTPWSAPESGVDTITEDSFEISGGPGGTPCAGSKKERPFAPTFSAGTAGTGADTFSPLEFRLTRKDGEQELKGIQITLPPGLTGRFAGIGTCSGAQIAAAERVTGKTEQATPSCPASSQLGTVTSGAGIGGSPVYVKGKIYLAGPYKGAPLSVVAIIPALAGPFDLGNVVSRAATYLDPVTAQPTAVTDPIPDILEGVPAELRSIKIDLDRPGFILTPTSCSKKSISAKLTGAGGETVSPADDSSVNIARPFQVGGCGALAFEPRLRAKLRGGTGRNSHPSLRTVVSYPPGAGYANTAFAQVALPHSEFLDQGHIDTVCTRVQFAAHVCPKGSIYGHAVATTPLLDEPLRGPIYLRSSDNKLPDLVIALRGPASRPIEVDVDGRVDSIHGGIRTTFDATPDAPVRKLIVTLKGGDKGLLVNSRDLCKARKEPRMTVRLLGQNGKRADPFPVLENDCGGKTRHEKHQAHRKTS